MLTYTQDTIRKNSILHARQINNTIDCDVIADAYFKLEAMNLGNDPQDVYDGLHYLLAAIRYRTKNTLWMELCVNSFGDTMSLAEHIKNKNYEAIKRCKNMAENGGVIRIM